MAKRWRVAGGAGGGALASSLQSSQPHRVTGYRAADHIATGHSAQSSRLALTHPSLRTRRSRRLLWPKRQTARCLQGRSEAQRGKHARQQVFGREDEDEALTRWVGALVASQAGLLHEPAHRQSTRNLVPRIMWTLELQRWPHTSDTCVMADGCVMAARLHA